MAKAETAREGDSSQDVSPGAAVAAGPSWPSERTPLALVIAVPVTGVGQPYYTLDGRELICFAAELGQYFMDGTTKHWELPAGAVLRFRPLPSAPEWPTSCPE